MRVTTLYVKIIVGVGYVMKDYQMTIMVIMFIIGPDQGQVHIQTIVGEV